MKSDRCERHRSKNRVPAVHQSSRTTDTLPQWRLGGGLAVNIYYVGMSPISSQGASVAQVPNSKGSFPIILPLYQQAAVAYLSIHMHICLRGCLKLICKF